MNIERLVFMIASTIPCAIILQACKQILNFSFWLYLFICLCTGVSLGIFYGLISRRLK